MQTLINVNTPAPVGFSIKMAYTSADASAIVTQLEDQQGRRVCGAFVAGVWSYHVPQNKQKTAKMTTAQRQAIAAFSESVAATLPPSWFERHAKMYAEE